MEREDFFADYLLPTLLVVFVVATVFFSWGASAQTRQDAFSADNVKGDTALLSRLPDGGCEVRWCGTLTSDDGGTSERACAQRELKGAGNRNQCLAAINLGAGPLGVAFRVQVDGGAP